MNVLHYIKSQKIDNHRVTWLHEVLIHEIQVMITSHLEVMFLNNHHHKSLLMYIGIHPSIKKLNLMKISTGKVTWNYTQGYLKDVLCRTKLGNDVSSLCQSEPSIRKLPLSSEVFRHTDQLMHMQSFNQIAHSGDSGMR